MQKMAIISAQGSQVYRLAQTLQITENCFIPAQIEINSSVLQILLQFRK